MQRSTCCLLALIVAAVIDCSTAKDYFTAAVYEHARQGSIRQPNTTADYIKRINLQYYERAAAKAKEEGADLILYPEYGIFSHQPRDTPGQEELLEYIPDPKEVCVTPCDEAFHFFSRPILLSLSCIAKNNQMVVVANMGGRESCVGQPDCREDGEFRNSVNVAFDQRGTLITRYFKQHLFYEFGWDVPREEQDPIVETDIGKFATFITFDLNFKRIVEVAERTDIDAILFSTLWLNFSPFFTSIQWWQSWAMGTNTTLLASNVQIPNFCNTGSGMYRGLEGSIVSTFNPDGISKLMVATVPKRYKSISSTSKLFLVKENEIEEWFDERSDLPPVCSLRLINATDNLNYDYCCTDDDVSNYTLHKLTEAEDYIKVCNNGMCCELDYSADSMEESYYLGCFNGTRDFFTRYFFSQENCFLARCDDANGTTCSHFPMYSETNFHRIHMKSIVSTNYVYPSMMSSGMRLVPVPDWTYSLRAKEASIEMNSGSGIRVLQATLMGSVYDKDPPYER